MSTITRLLLGLLMVYVSKARVTQHEQASCGAPVTNTGREFVFGCSKGYSIKTLSIIITADRAGSVELTAPRLSTVPRVYQLTNESTVINLNTSVVSKVTGINRNGIRLVADIDIQVTLAIIDSLDQKTVLIAPVKALSTDYTVITTGDGFNSVFLIAAAFNDTDIHIRFPNNYEADKQITLHEWQTYQHRDLGTKYDLTGTAITSSRPVYVVSGTEFTPVPVKASVGNTIVESMLPRDSWDNLYIVPPAPPQKGYLVKIVHGASDTAVTLSNHSKSWNTTLSKLEHIETLCGLDPLVIQSDTQVMIAQLGTSNDFQNQNIGDPFLAVVPGVHQYLDNYTFTVPSFPNVLWNYLAITVPSKVESELILNGGPVNVTHRFTVSPPLANYTVLVARVPEGLHHIYSRNNKTFGALLYGYHSIYSYGSAVGLRFRGKENKTCNAAMTGQTNQCMACTDMAHPALCDHVQRCTSNQVCSVHRYKLSPGEIRYRSGCHDQVNCAASAINTADSCMECCSGDFCNLQGCGVAKIPRDQRGPFCYDCAHVGDPKQCHHTTVCDKNQVCVIEKQSWIGTLFHYKMGCQTQQDCLDRKRAASSVSERSSLLCRQCCQDDFCNDKCQTTGAPSIIG